MKTQLAIGALLLAAAFALPKSEALLSFLPKAPQADDVAVTVPEDQVWDELAAWAASGQVKDTDELRRIASGLKSLGKVSDTSRLDKYTTNGPVTPEVLETLRK